MNGTVAKTACRILTDALNACGAKGPKDRRLNDTLFLPA